jgi:hypothetical protein
LRDAQKENCRRQQRRRLMFRLWPVLVMAAPFVVAVIIRAF